MIITSYSEYSVLADAKFNVMLRPDSIVNAHGRDDFRYISVIPHVGTTRKADAVRWAQSYLDSGRPQMLARMYMKQKNIRNIRVSMGEWLRGSMSYDNDHDPSVSRGTEFIVSWVVNANKKKI